MAITIRNKETERIIREIGQETGEGPSSLIGRWAREARMRREAERTAAVEERRKALRQLLKETPPVSEQNRCAVWKELDEMYDEDGLPR